MTFRHGLTYYLKVFCSAAADGALSMYSNKEQQQHYLFTHFILSESERKSEGKRECILQTLMIDYIGNYFGNYIPETDLLLKIALYLCGWTEQKANRMVVL